MAVIDLILGENVNQAVEDWAYIAYRKLLDDPSMSRQAGYRKSLEVRIAKSARCSCLYARNVLHHRFKEGEATIIQDPEWIIHYTSFLKSLGYSDDNLKALRLWS